MPKLKAIEALRWITALMISLSLVHWSGAAPAQPVAQPVQHPTVQVQRGTEDSPVFIREARSDTEQQSEREKEVRQARREDQLNDLTKKLADYTQRLYYATVLLALATIGLLALGAFQLRGAKASVRAAEQSAAAAERSAQVASDTLTRLERPWLLLVTVIVNASKAFENQPTCRVSLTFENLGRSPAIVDDCVVIAVGIRSFPAGDPPRYSFAARSRESRMTRDAVSANQQTMVSWEGPIDVRSDEERVRAGYNFVVYGRVDYKDFHGASHHTAFIREVSAQPQEHAKVMKFSGAGLYESYD